MRPLVARPDGELEVLGGFRPAARSGGRLVKLEASAMIPLPEGTTLMHLPGRRALALDSKDRPVDVEADLLPVAAVLPVGHLRTLLPASRPLPASRRLPLYGYAAVVEHHDELMVAALSTDAFGWWEPRRYKGGGIDAAIESARQALPGNRLVDHLAICATDLRCYTAQNTFLRRYEGALPASPACNADCLGCISLQTDGQAPAPQPRMRFAPTADELAGMASFHLGGSDAGIVSFGQGCEGEPLTRDDVLARAVDDDPQRSIPRRQSTSIPTEAAHRSCSGSSTRAATASGSAPSRSPTPCSARTTAPSGTRSTTSSNAAGSCREPAARCA